MNIQFDNNETIVVTRSPYHSEVRLVAYIAPGQISVEDIVAQAKAAEHVYFYVNDAVVATYTGYTSFNSVSMNDTEITLTMINPNPERQENPYAEYVEAVQILLGDDTIGNDVENTEVQ